LTGQAKSGSWQRQGDDAGWDHEQMPFERRRLIDLGKADDEHGRGARPQRASEIERDGGAEHGIALSREAGDADGPGPAGTIVRPGGVPFPVPFPGIVIPDTGSAAEEEGGSARGIISHGRLETRGRPGRHSRSPRAAVPLPGVAVIDVVSTAEE